MSEWELQWSRSEFNKFMSSHGSPGRNLRAWPSSVFMRVQSSIKNGGFPCLVTYLAGKIFRDIASSTHNIVICRRNVAEPNFLFYKTLYQ